MSVAVTAGYSALVFSRKAEIRQRAPAIRSVSRTASPVLDPEFFLASIDASRWKPYVVTVSLGKQIIGALYSKERTVGGIRTGLIFADETFGGVVAAPGQDHDFVLETGLVSALKTPGIRGVRLAIPTARFEERMFRRVASSAGVEFHVVSSQTRHARLTLPATYEGFLNGLGPTTRRNFRYYRRRSEQAGNTYCEGLTLDECRRAAYCLSPQCSTYPSPQQLMRALDMVAAVPRPLLVGLRNRSGEWLSLAGGLCHAGSATLIFQLNGDRAHPRDSLSAVLRSYLIEHLIERGTRELTFWGGAAGALYRYAEGLAGVQVYLDVRGAGWRAMRIVAASLPRSIPKHIAALADWVAPRHNGDSTELLERY